MYSNIFSHFNNFLENIDNISEEDLNYLDAFSASISNLGNVGPGFGNVGSLDNFSQIPAMGKFILALQMLFGRLEIYSLIIMFSMKSSMKTIKPQKSASGYTVLSSFKLNGSRDRFLYSRITRVAKPQNNSSGSGSRSSGGSHRGGRF